MSAEAKHSHLLQDLATVRSKDIRQEAFLAPLKFEPARQKAGGPLPITDAVLAKGPRRLQRRSAEVDRTGDPHTDSPA